MTIIKQDGKIVFEPSLFVSRVDGDALANASFLYSQTRGNARANLSLVGAVVDGDAGANLSLGYAVVGASKDYRIGDIFKRVTKYLPKCVQDIYLPALNFGAVTNTKAPENSFILGIFNNVEDTGKDYIAVGVVNKVKNKDKTHYRIGISGRVGLDGILTHANNSQLTQEAEK